MTSDRQTPPPAPPASPIFNAPQIVTYLALALVGLHAVMSVVPNETRLQLLLWFSFIPMRYGDIAQAPGGDLSAWATPLTYAFLHGSWMHVFGNVLWMLAFGSAVAWRFGAKRFLVLSALSAIGGAAAHYWIYPNSFVPVVGASAAVSGQMAAASRFVFDRRGPLRLARYIGPNAFRFPAEPLATLVTNAGALAFIGIWFAFNFLFGLTGDTFVGAGIAWEAHIGGFVIGFLLFSLLDRPSKQPKEEISETDRNLL